MRGELRRDWPAPAGRGGAGGGRRARSAGGVRLGRGRSFSINKAPDWSGGIFFFSFARALAPFSLAALVGARRTAGKPRTRGPSAGGLFSGQAVLPEGSEPGSGSARPCCPLLCLGRPQSSAPSARLSGAPAAGCASEKRVNRGDQTLSGTKRLEKARSRGGPLPGPRGRLGLPRERTRCQQVRGRAAGARAGAGLDFALRLSPWSRNQAFSLIS